MSYLSTDTHQRLIADPSLIETYYVQLWRTFAGDLGPLDAGMWIGSSMLPVAFAAIVAWDLKRYGPEPYQVDLASILASPTLACDDYVRLTWYFTQFMPQVTWMPAATMVAIGVNGGAVGNHAQMMISAGPQGSLLLDPTIGLIARTNFNDLFRGVPIAPTSIASFERYNADSLDSFRATVRGALINGSYRPGDLLYYVKTLDTYTTTMPPIASWLTPQAA